MKILKLNHEFAEQVLAGERTSTVRMFDDKDISVYDELEILDKVDPQDRSSWRPIGVARVTAVLEKPLGALTDSDLAGHQTYATDQEKLDDFRRHYGADVNLDTPTKVIQFSFTPLTVLEQDVENITTDSTEVKLFSDGGSRGNPGPSSCGFVLYDSQDNMLFREGVYLGITTNNQAEYLGLKLGLEKALHLHARTVHVYMDSLLVVNQMKGIFKIKNRDLWPIHGAVKELLPKFKKVTFTHVPRELNKEADAAVNEALDAELAKQSMV